jgi:hypothetical protein
LLFENARVTPSLGWGSSVVMNHHLIKNEINRKYTTNAGKACFKSVSVVDD